MASLARGSRWNDFSSRLWGSASMTPMDVRVGWLMNRLASAASRPGWL